MAVLRTAYGLTSHREQTLHCLKRNNRVTKRTTETPPPRHLTDNRIRLSHTGPSEVHNFVQGGQKRRNAVRKSAHVNEQARQMLVTQRQLKPTAPTSSWKRMSESALRKDGGGWCIYIKSRNRQDLETCLGTKGLSNVPLERKRLEIARA